MKRPISWHENCLENSRKFYDQLRLTILREISDYARGDSENKEYANQIAMAKKRGISAFDADRFGKKRSALIIRDRRRCDDGR